MKKKTIGQAMRKSPVKEKDPQVNNQFISIYRISLVRDRQMKFDVGRTENSVKAHIMARKMIEKYGQSDREQFFVILLNAENQTIGLNMVSTGTISSTVVMAREVLKPAILANASAMILCHNHPGGNLKPSKEDIKITRKIVAASRVMGIHIHEHLIISMDTNQYFSMADNGMISDLQQEVRRMGW